MSVLIKGMEMPTSCCDCFMDKFICLCNKSDISPRRMARERHPDCPLIPVPPHGRLGDLDSLEIKMWNREYKHGRESDPDCLVVDAPTIIPADPPKEET